MQRRSFLKSFAAFLGIAPLLKVDFDSPKPKQAQVIQKPSLKYNLAEEIYIGGEFSNYGPRDIRAGDLITFSGQGGFEKYSGTGYVVGLALEDSRDGR